jgi:tetratricopeptide (TPR) repeat protein
MGRPAHAWTLILVLASTPALAQSKRYPADAGDDDDSTHSNLWEAALHPDVGPYKDLVRDAKRLLDEGTDESIRGAELKLTDAIHRVPSEADAYALRGKIHLARREWGPCADDLAAADDRSKADDDPSTADVRARLRIDLATCDARVGRLAEAEAALLRAQSGQHLPSEVALRLGEVRIAMGKLDEAIDALTAPAAESQPMGNQGAMLHWLLAEAYDRARRPGEAQAQVELALRYDRNLSTIEAPAYPWLGIGEREYLYGIAYALPPQDELGAARPEYALLYFRRFLEVAPKSPWRRRAEEHVKELTTMTLPLLVKRDGGSATLDLPTATTAVRKQMAAMRTCVAKVPVSAISVALTRTGPRTPETVRDRPIYRLPPAGTTVEVSLNVSDTDRSGTDAAIRCVQGIAEKLSLPAVKERDAYYKVSFLVVAP